MDLRHRIFVRAAVYQVDGVLIHAFLRHAHRLFLQRNQTVGQRLDPINEAVFLLADAQCLQPLNRPLSVLVGFHLAVIVVVVDLIARNDIRADFLR